MRSRRSTSGFTLIELLVVVGLIAGLTFFLVRGMSGGKGAALQSAQATLSNYLIAVRTKAVASGQGARLLVHNDPAAPEAAKRYLRYLALQVFDGANWNTVADTFLPEGTALMPRDLTVPSNLVDPMKSWIRPSDNTALRSSSLRATTELDLRINSTVSERWSAIAVSAAGTTGNNGDLVLGSITYRAPGSYSVGESPVQFDDPQSVRGVSFGTYGVAVLVNGLHGF